MGQRILAGLTVVAVLLAAVAPAGNAGAVGLKEFGLSVGLDLIQQGISVSPYTSGVGGQFDGARLAVGGYLDLGQVIIPEMYLVAGTDMILEEHLTIITVNTDVRYRFARKLRSNGYIGGGLGVHFSRPDPSQSIGLQNDTRVSVNIPLGYQRRLAGAMGWFGEMKLLIADERKNSSFRFSLGLTFGPGS